MSAAVAETESGKLYRVDAEVSTQPGLFENRLDIKPFGRSDFDGCYLFTFG